MPIYEYACASCKAITERYGEITEEQPEETECQEGCGKARRLFLPTRVRAATFQEYFDPHIKYGGTWISSREQKRRLMKEQGVRQTETDEVASLQYHERYKVRDEKKLTFSMTSTSAPSSAPPPTP